METNVPNHSPDTAGGESCPPNQRQAQRLDQCPEWLLYSNARARQRMAGLVAAVLLILAMAILVDGLFARMRGGGSYRLEMLAGTSEPVSGPMGSAPAVESDMRAFPIPVDAPISFEFQGFFTSYWFGTGMWRGLVHVSETAPSGTYALAVGIEGQPSSSFQTYTISVARSEREQYRNALSLVRRWTGFNPFWLAATFGILGIGTGLTSFLLGRRLNALLRDMGLAEIVKVVPEGDLVRVYAVQGKREVTEQSYVAYDRDMKRLGKVIYDGEKNGIASCLFVPAGHGMPTPGSFIAFWERADFTGTPMRRGVFTPLLEKGMQAVRDKGAAEAGADARPDSQPGSQTGSAAAKAEHNAGVSGCEKGQDKA